MRFLKSAITTVFGLIALNGSGQTGHVLNDIQTLFTQYDDLRRQIWRVQKQLKEASANSDSVLSVRVGLLLGELLAVQRSADSLTHAMLIDRVDGIEKSQSETGTGERSIVSKLPLILGALALLISAFALWVNWRRNTGKRNLPAPTLGMEDANEMVRRLIAHMESSREVAAPDEAEDDSRPAAIKQGRIAKEDGQITPTILSRRSQIMKELEQKSRDSSKKVQAVKSPSLEDRKRNLTDRASELILHTSRGTLNESEREEAEKEIAGILREIMTLR